MRTREEIEQSSYKGKDDNIYFRAILEVLLDIRYLLNNKD